LVSSNSRPLCCLGIVRNRKSQDRQHNGLELEHTKGVIRNRKSQDRQHNGLELEDTKGIVRNCKSQDRQHNGLELRFLIFILPFEFGTFVWTSIIFNSGIFTFSKSKHVLLKIGRLQLPYGRRDNQTFFFNLKIEADDFSLKMSGDRKLAIYNALLTKNHLLQS
jgi:hypothetical protein